MCLANGALSMLRNLAMQCMYYTLFKRRAVRPIAGTSNSPVNDMGKLEADHEQRHCPVLG